MYEVIIVGAGPAGLSAAARAHHYGLNYLVLEQRQLANTLDQEYQDGKFVMALSAVIPLRSDLEFAAGSREDVLGTWTNYAAQQQLNIRVNTPVTAITKKDGFFEVKTAVGQMHTAKYVVLAIGKLGSPRKLHAPGEQLAHVSYRLRNPQAFSGQDILVVGAGDSAAEVAIALSAQNSVVLVNRKDKFYRMNEALQSQIEQKMRSKEITVYFGTEVDCIEKDSVTLKFPDNRQVRIKADSIFVKIGAEIPRAFLERCGITFPSDHSTALPERNERYETKVPGLFLIGSVGGKDLIKYAMNQGYEVIEYILGHAPEPVDEAPLREQLQCIPGATVDEKLTYIAAAVPLLSQIPCHLRELALGVTVHRVKTGEVIFQEQDYSTALYTIVEGSVEVSCQANPHKKIRLHQGEFFGEMALISDRRRSATITAIAPSLLLEIPRRAVLKLLQAEPSVKRLIDAAYVLRALQTYLCPDLSPADYHEVATKTEFKTFQKDEVIFQAGDPGDAFYMVRSGSVKISRRNTEGKEYIIAYLPVGAYFGEIALLDTPHNIRTATVTAATRTEVMRISKDDFLVFLNQYPHLREQLRVQITKRDLERAMVLAAPRKELLADFIQYGVIESTDVLLIDEMKCIRCDNCVAACAATHNGQTRLDRVAGPSFARIHVPIACRHCEGAPCLQDCPPGDAIERAPNGVVQIDAGKCIGCGRCAENCPYRVISMVEAPQKRTVWERFSLLDLLPGRKRPDAAAESHREVAIKCDLCKSIDVHNDMVNPACVQSCPTGAAIRVRPDYFTQVEFR